ncbi:LytR cell envelope-related transcriptional attenuator [Saccharopolyspora kobensis]|uniref:LytR cell envelope-related transcriptional attenuator n=1 Tax=Saccharopolyspora kobensis TaxID=146035 RepID=A0A1H6EJM4_9PSEU|nr:LytR C-terminal domain-containing protein [Saccharopolyspora kobensis]SEG98088.1 LytR cell envelope-related transcriptional attenuator [Saccharopolyspora kobensis]SFE95704.1 LytR cell envelope-related transcriptional attenuator [Saccharopolyspora kobensis]
MTSGESAGPAKAKLIGFGLIGAGVIAGAIGIATLVSGGDAPNSAQPLPPEPGNYPAKSSLVQQPPPPPATEPAQQPENPPAPLPSPEDQSSQQVPPPQQRPDSPGGSGQQAEVVVVRVYNNSTISGLAHRAAEDFRRNGYDVPEVGNYSAGLIPTTTVYFRPGTPEEAQAKQLAARFGARVEPRFDGIQDATPGLIAIITNDYKGPVDAK